MLTSTFGQYEKKSDLEKYKIDLVKNNVLFKKTKKNQYISPFQLSITFS